MSILIACICLQISSKTELSSTRDEVSKKRERDSFGNVFGLSEKFHGHLLNHRFNDSLSVTVTVACIYLQFVQKIPLSARLFEVCTALAQRQRPSDLLLSQRQRQSDPLLSQRQRPSDLLRPQGFCPLKHSFLNSRFNNSHSASMP